jgi:hypothetical protein
MDVKPKSVRPPPNGGLHGNIVWVDVNCRDISTGGGARTKQIDELGYLQIYI